MTKITTPTTFLSNLHLFGGQDGGYQSYHLAQPSFPVWGVVLAVAVTSLALLGIVILRRGRRA